MGGGAENADRWWSGAAGRWRTRAVDRWRSAGLALLRPGPPPRTSRWTWTADAVLALALAVCTVTAAQRPHDAGMPPDPAVVFGPGAVPVPAVPRLPRPMSPMPPGMLPADAPGQAAHVWAGYLTLAALAALPLVVRRRYPLAAFWAVIVLTSLFNAREGAGDSTVYTFLSCVVAAYSAAVYSPHRRSALVSLVAGAGLVAIRHDENFPYFTPGVVPFLLLLMVGLGANAIHTWKQRVHVLQEQQEAATRRAVDRERARIARELHDVVTHNVSVMVIQAGAARKVMGTAPDRAREALLAVEAGGRTAMTELRHVMGLLTMGGDDRPLSGDGFGDLSGHAPADGADPAADADLAPQPGLGRLPALVDRIRATGVPVDLTVTGTPVPLPAGVDLAAYRVVQEALTNTIKHAAGAHVLVAVEHVPGAVHVEVCDTGGTAAAPAGPGGGHGLIGLRERLAVYGGTLAADPRPTGGFRVRAVIPVEETEDTGTVAMPAGAPS